ncbi:Fic family protein [Candidatus Pacearchaeota archaeon]|nr:Fic family protein [Candidatus Pacearchaeota archaeon]
MVSTKIKNINGKKYLYAEHSFRLPNGKIKKISKLIKNQKDKDNKNIKEYFLRKQIEAHQKYAFKNYKKDSIFTKDQLNKLESIKIEYKEILKNFTKKQIKDILDRFTINFTYESNAIEGNSLTLKDVTMILKENIVPKNKDLREVYEIRNTREANELLFYNKIKISLTDIVKIHSIIVKDTGVQIGFKKIPNYLIMRNLKTTPPEKVRKEMNELINWYNKNKNLIYPLKLATEFHARFEKIHPFEDGNGRIGRILLNAILLEKGYPPLIIRKTARIAYFSSLEAFDKGYKPKLERFLLEKFKKTFNNFFKIYVKYL